MSAQSRRRIRGENDISTTAIINARLNGAEKLKRAFTICDQRPLKQTNEEQLKLFFSFSDQEEDEEPIACWTISSLIGLMKRRWRIEHFPRVAGPI